MPIIVNNSVRKLNGSSLRDHMKIRSRQELAHGPLHYFTHPSSPTPPPVPHLASREGGHTLHTVLPAVALELGRAK